jgi:hypothetical protein
MSTTQPTAKNASGTEDRSIDYNRYERACHEEMTISWAAPNMATVGHNDENYGVDLVEGACECPDSTYRHVYCKHVIKAALVAIYEQGVPTAFVAKVARYVADHPCPFDNHSVCTGPTGPGFPCQDCVEATTVGEWVVWQQTAGRTGERR